MSAEPDTATLTDSGWPRPVVDGYPIPWVSPASDLAQTNGDRHETVLAQVLCQVCGCGHDPGEPVYLFINDGTAVAGEDVGDKWAEPIDDAALHERCARLAAGRCPALKRLREEGKLVVVSCPVEAISRRYDDEYKEDRLMADGALCIVLDSEQFLSRRA